MYISPSAISRRLTVRLLPPRLARGTWGSINAHSSWGQVARIAQAAAVERQQLRPVELQHSHDQSSRQVCIQSFELKKLLQTPVVRRMQRVARKLARQMAEVHCPSIRKTYKQNCQRLNTLLTQSKMRA
jgi:uncharacterized protein with von Willebrand factor type A (vWA) domain